MWRYIDLRLFKSLILILVFAGCKKNDAIDPAASPGSLTYNEIAQSLTIMERASLKVEQFFQNETDTVDVLFDVAEWLYEQGGASEVYIIDDYMLEVHHTNGLVTDLVLEFVDPNGKAFIRGPGSGGSLTSFGTEETYLKLLQEKVIKNRKVLVFVPFNNQFYGGNYPFLNKIKKAPVGLDVTIVSEKNADLAVLNTFKDYGLIIINTHGKQDGFQVKTQAPLFIENRIVDTSKVVQSMLVEQQMRAAGITPRQLADGDIKLNAYLQLEYDGNNFVGFKYRYGIQVTDKHIRKLPRLDKAVVYGNYCYSGYTKDGPNISNIPEAFKSIGAITYYGYARDDQSSDAVDTDVAEQVESSLLDKLLYKMDSTGYAHLKSDGSEWDDPSTRKRINGGQKTKINSGSSGQLTRAKHKRKLGPPIKMKHFFDEHYYYDCPDTLIDPRDLQVYRTVCIGDQVWMAENLNWAGAGECYDNSSSNCDVFGRLYSLDETTGKQSSTPDSIVQGICPPGWHVPSQAEFQKLFDYVGGRNFAGDSLKADTIWTGAYKDNLGFAALPSGRKQPDAMGVIGFWGLGTVCEFWTSTIDQSPTRPYIIVNFRDNSQSGSIAGGSEQGRKLACRCIKD